MNLRQQIVVSAIKSAIEVSEAPTTEHAQQSAQIETFNKSGFDPLDYPIWVASYIATRNTIASLGNQKTTSEMQPAKK